MPRTRTIRRRRAIRRTRRQSGGESRVYYGKVSNSAGKNYTNANFSKGNNRGTNAYWQDINALLSAHVRKHFDESEIVSDGFGGDDSSGVVVVKSKKALPAMKFSIAGKAYTMTFDRFENNA